MIVWAHILVCARFLALRRALGFLSPCQLRVLTKFCTFTAVMVSHGNMQLATLQLLALLQEMVKLLPVSPRSKEEDHKKKFCTLAYQTLHGHVSLSKLNFDDDDYDVSPLLEYWTFFFPF